MENEKKEYEKLPYFTDKFKEVLLPPKKGETIGEYIDIKIIDINTYPKLSQFKNNDGSDKFEYWTTIEFEGIKYSWRVSGAVLKAILKTGITKSELPIVIQLASYSEFKNGEKKKGYNSKCEGHRGDWKASLEELINTYEGKNHNVTTFQQPQQLSFNPSTANYSQNDKERQESIIRGMAFNAGIQLFIAKKAKDEETIEDKALQAYNAYKSFVAKLNTPEEIIKGVGDFPVDESDISDEEN